MDIKKRDLATYTSHLNLLYVEDDYEVQWGMSKGILSGLFQNLFIANDGEEGLELFHKHRPDIIITDINMPKMNGLEMVEKIRHDDEFVNIIVTTAYNDQEYFIDSIKLGIDRYLTKPIDKKALYQTLFKITQEIENRRLAHEYKTNLENRVKEEILKRKEKEKMLLQQSKLAAMGEMIAAISHQWKQPVSVIKMQIDMLRFETQTGDLDNELALSFCNKADLQIDHMLNTMEEFRNFFRPGKEKTEFSVKSCIESVLHLTKDEMMKNKIGIEILGEDFGLLGFKNEFKHLLLNLITNARDAFSGKEIKNRKIIFELFEDETFKRLCISDNAGGIPDEIVDSIFKPNVTTKADGEGTGTGLYLSNQIAYKHNGTLSVANNDNGAKFTFLLDKRHII